MGFLTDPIGDHVYYQNKRYMVYPSFDTVLEVQRLFQEKELSDLLKLRQALKMFIGNEKRIRNLSIESMKELLEKIFKECINTIERPATRPEKEPVFDFEYDGEYIYSSFMLDYGIDLIDMQGRLHWKKFIALFQGLSEQSKIREVMRIRKMEVPRFTGKNGKQIQNILELKSYYALPVRGGGGQKGLDALFSTLERMAVRND